MTITHVVGVDPGLVHTGVVRFVFDPDIQIVTVEHVVVDGLLPNNSVRSSQEIALATQLWINRNSYTKPVTFIERYVPRSHFNTDARMAEIQAAMKAAFPATTILNTGVKKVVKKTLMDLLDVWSFTTVTNHQDLRSAARIALFGMLKSESMNRLLSDVVRDHLAGGKWRVTSQ